MDFLTAYLPLPWPFNIFGTKDKEIPFPNTPRQLKGPTGKLLDNPDALDLPYNPITLETIHGPSSSSSSTSRPSPTLGPSPNPSLSSLSSLLLHLKTISHSGPISHSKFTHTSKPLLHLKTISHSRPISHSGHTYPFNPATHHQTVFIQLLLFEFVSHARPISLLGFILRLKTILIKLSLHELNSVFELLLGPVLLELIHAFDTEEISHPPSARA